MRTCIICGKERTNKKQSKTCGNKCGGVLSRKNRKSNAIKKRIKRTCWNCNAEIELCPKSYRAHHEVPIFHNNDCYIDYIRKNGHPRKFRQTWGSYIKIKDVEKFARDVYEWRRERGLTQAQAGIQTGICQSFFSKAENFVFNHMTKERQAQIKEKLGIIVEGEIAKHPKWAERRREK